MLAYTLNRNARKLALSVEPVTAEKLTARRQFLGDRCYMCGATDALEWDHVKPLAVGGLHAPANLRLACKAHNRRKAARWYGVAGLPRLIHEVLTLTASA